MTEQSPSQTTASDQVTIGGTGSSVRIGDIDAILGWGLTCIALLIMQGFLKEWMFARMNMLMLLKEVKRLQLQVADLTVRQS